MNCMHRCVGSRGIYAGVLALAFTVSCRPHVDRASPESVAGALVKAMNSGSLRDVEYIVGDKFLQTAQESCREFKTKPEPQRNNYGRDSLGMGESAFQQASSKYREDCEKIPDKFKLLLLRVKNSSGYSIRTSEESDGEFRVRINPPDDEKHESMDVWRFKQIDGEWHVNMPSFGWPKGDFWLGGTNFFMARKDLQEVIAK